MNVVVKDNTTEVPTVILRPDMRSMGEVTVSGNTINRVDNYLQIIPDKLSVKHAFTGYQLLYNLMLPGFEIDTQTGSVKLFGSNVSMFVNGVPAEFRMVQNLRPKDVEKIEYHDVPTGRYAGCFAAINFITKNNPLGGYVTFDAQQRVGGSIAGAYNVFAQVNKEQTKYYVYGGYENFNGSNGHNEKMEFFDLKSGSVSREYCSVGDRSRSNTAYGNLQIQSNLKKGYIFSNFGVVGTHSVRDNGGRMVYTSPETTDQSTKSRGTDVGLRPRLRVSTLWNITDKQLVFVKLTGTYGNNRYDYSYFTGEDRILSYTKERMFITSFQATYDIKFSHSNHLAIVAMDEFRNSRAIYDGTTDSHQRLWTLNGKYFAEYDHNLNQYFRFNAQLGLASVNMLLKGYQRQDFYSPIVYSRLIYSPASRHQLTFQLMTGEIPVGFSMRTGAEQQIDMIMTRRGNPSLKNNAEASFKIMYNGFERRFNFGAYFALDYDHNSVIVGYHPENERLIMSFYNGDKRSVTFMPSVTWSIKDNFRAKLSGSLMHTGFSGPNGKKQLNSGLARLELMYYLRDFSFSLSGITPQRNLANNYNRLSIPAQYSINLGWNHKNWYVAMWANNIFNKPHNTARINVGVYDMEQTTWFKRYATAKIAYTFDFGKKVKRERMEADTSIESNILK